LYLRLLTPRQAACGGPSNDLLNCFVVFVIFVVKVFLRFSVPPVKDQ